jgi:hypothetical protein
MVNLMIIIMWLGIGLYGGLSIYKTNVDKDVSCILAVIMFTLN